MEQQRCRCCSTTKSEHYFGLFEKYKTTRTYAENIHHIAEVDVELGDGLPQYACSDCFSELQNVIEFALVIRQTDEKLRMQLRQQCPTSVGGKTMVVVESDQVLEEGCIAADEVQEDMQVCILEEEELDGEDTLHQQAEMTIVEEYVKDENVDDLQMVEEILEFDEEVPNDSIEHIMRKENDPLQELAQVAATQENVHVSQIRDPDYYAEDECDEEYLIEFNLAEELHGNFKPPKWKCVECKTILRGDVSYEGHMNIHKNIRPHKCPQCPCQFRCRNSLKKHKETRHTNALSAHNTKIEEISIVQMKCLDCDAECQTEVDLFKHEISAHDKHSHSTSCPFCPDVIVDNLLNHLQSVHTDQPSRLDDEATETLLEPLPSSTITFSNCNMCSKTYSSLSALTRHRKVYHDVAIPAEHVQGVSSNTPITSWHCDRCSKTYSSLSVLNHHRKLCHGTDDADEIVMDEYVCYVDMLDSIVHCEICKKKLQRKNLSKHMAMHERKVKEAEEKPTKLLCAYCPREFKNSKCLNQHEKTHRGESADIVYVCGDCDRQYSSHFLLETHRKQAHKDRDHVCSICGNAFKLKNQLMNHMKLHLEKNIQCPHCEKKYARQFDLNVHLRSHTGELPYSCHLCDKRFAIKVRLTYHLQKHYGVKHQCKECHAEFNSKQKLKAHSFKHTGMPYRCELCDDHGFANRVVFKRHLNRVHHASMSDEALSEMFQRYTGKTIKIKQVSDPYMVPSPEDAEIEEEIIEERPVLISSSDTVTESEIMHAYNQLFNAHLSIKLQPHLKFQFSNEISSKAYICISQTFLSDIQLNNHVTSTHYTTVTAESCVVHLQYECTKCDEAFEDNHLLKEHDQNQHYFADDQPKYVCKICGNLFGGHAQLSAHKRLHKERPFKCDQCEKAYPRKVELDIHIRTHTGELPYACHLCDKRFAIKVRLTYHLQKHEGVKHSCPYCSAVYDNRNKLKAHLFKHTGMPYKCELCPGLGFERRLRFSNHMQRVHQRILTDDELAEIFAKNTGKTIRFKSTIEKNS